MTTKIIGAAIVVFAAVVAYMIGTRIDGETISLLSGTLIGIVVTTPCASLITYILVRRTSMPTQPVTQPAQQWQTPLLEQPTVFPVIQIQGQLYRLVPMPTQSAQQLPAGR